MSLMFTFAREMFFFESGDTEVLKADRNKLFASINGKLTIIRQCLCVTTIVEVFLKSFFFYFTQGNLQSGRVEDYGMMFTWHLYILQSYIQAGLYIYITYYMMSLTLYTPISECIFSILFSIYFLMCWQGEFV